MKLLSYIFFALILTSCSASRLFQDGLKKIEKAQLKDPSLKLPNDTITVTSTTIQIDTFENVITKTITNTITNTVNECNYDEFKAKSARELRSEKRMYKDSLNHQEKMYKLETNRLSDSLNYLSKLNKQLTKQLKSTNLKEKNISKFENKCSWWSRTFGKLWWLFLIVGIAIGLYIRTWVQRFLPFLFKRKTDGKITGTPS